MTHRLTSNYAKNYCIVKVIVENVVTCFLGHSVERLFLLKSGKRDSCILYSKYVNYTYL